MPRMNDKPEEWKLMRDYRREIAKIAFRAMMENATTFGSAMKANKEKPGVPMAAVVYDFVDAMCRQEIVRHFPEIQLPVSLDSVKSKTRTKKSTQKLQKK